MAVDSAKIEAYLEAWKRMEKAKAEYGKLLIELTEAEAAYAFPLVHALQMQARA